MLDNIWLIWNIVTSIVTIASAIAVVTKTKKDDAFMAKINKFISLIALNIGNANPNKKV